MKLMCTKRRKFDSDAGPVAGSFHKVESIALKGTNSHTGV